MQRNKGGRIVCYSCKAFQSEIESYGMPARRDDVVVIHNSPYCFGANSSADPNRNRASSLSISSEAWAVSGRLKGGESVRSLAKVSCLSWGPFQTRRKRQRPPSADAHLVSSTAQWDQINEGWRLCDVGRYRDFFRRA